MDRRHDDRITRPQLRLRHLAPAVLFVALPVLWTWPLARHLSTDIPGWPGDNFAFLWNSWWMRVARASGQTPFRTDLLFAPYGIDLTLHTHTALSSWLAAALLGWLPVVVAHNVVMLGMLAANGMAAYLLAWQRVKDRGAATLAGVIFSGSPYLFAHLLGHVNLLTAWCMPLCAFLALRAIETGSLAAAIGAGAVVVLTGFNDYYYVVYSVALTAGLYLFVVMSVEWTRASMPPFVRRMAMTLLAIDAVLVGAIVLSGGFTTTLFGVRIAANRPTNLLALGWLLGLVLLIGSWRPHVRWRGRAGRAPNAERALAVMALVVVVGLSPVWLHGLSAFQAGQYTAPPPSWRSGPAGVDLITLVIGNPWHGLFGGVVRSFYDHWQINTVEGVGWLGAAPLWLAVVALTRHRGEREVRLWRWIGGVFFVWSLGPWLRIAGVDTGLLLPQNLLAHLPVVSNARMPGRAIVVVFMAVALLSAIALARLNGTAGRARLMLAALLVFADFWPVPFPMTRLETPALYTMLRELPPGAVCELPLGTRDGLKAIGRFDDRVLSYQMTHGHPIVGGFAARVPPSLQDRYMATPVMRSLWLLSDGKAADARDLALTPPAAGAALREATIRYVVINRASASDALAGFVGRSLPLRLIARDGDRELYELTP